MSRSNPLSAFFIEASCDARRATNSALACSTSTKSVNRCTSAIFSDVFPAPFDAALAVLAVVFSCVANLGKIYSSNQLKYKRGLLNVQKIDLSGGRGKPASVLFLTLHV